MRWSKLVGATGAAFVLFAATARAGALPSPPAGDYVLTATSTGARYAPTFTGNGRLGVRVPPAGQGYAGGSVPAQSELAGFYAKPSKPKNVSQDVQQRANIPTWSTLAFSDSGTTFSLGSGKTTAWRQSLDLRTGVVSTSATWRAPDGHVTRLAYQVLTDRASQWIGLVSLTITPQWTGTATVTDEINGAPADLSDQVAKGYDPAARQDWVTVRAQGTGIEATLASSLGASANVAGSLSGIDQGKAQSVGQQLRFGVRAGQSYTLTKYVGVGDSQQSTDTVAAARITASAAAAFGLPALRAASDGAWAQLWAGRIDLLGDRSLATDVNASEFYLWSSTRDGVNWSVSPAGLSSNGYDGHIFWDAETWMFPSLLAQHPTLAAAMEAYRGQRLGAAELHARATGYRGARFPWESALDGTEQIPPPVSVNSEGLYEQHITADIALAQWQYYRATQDRGWLALNGWPVISEAARFWASRATRDGRGRYHIRHVTGPDEENPNVNDEAFTNVAARTTLIDAVKAAQVLGLDHPVAWSSIAARLVVGVDAAQVHPEFSGYRGQLVKQADVTLLQYPWAFGMSRRLAQNDLSYYVPRTDPMGPSMSDAVNSIDSSALGTPGCSSFVFTQRSYQPFIRDVFHQFSETSTGGAFTFMTGIGGFLQEFLYGYSGMRLGADAVTLAPSLTRPLGGVVLRDVAWHRRTFTIAIRPFKTTVTLNRGRPLPLVTPAGHHLVSLGHGYTFATARPDLAGTRDRVRCAPATASSAAPGAPALAAVDGSSATDWAPASLPATLTVRIHGAQSVGRADVIWGRQWRPAPKPNVMPPPFPVLVRRATRYAVLVSGDGRHWRQVAFVRSDRGTTDVLSFPRVRARYLRLAITAASQHRPPLLQELRLTG